MVEIVAYIFTTLITAVVVFQLALTFGAPWGEFSMGGRFKGRYPTSMRIVSALNAVVLSVIALIVLARADMMLPSWYAFSETAIWVIVGLLIIGLILNLVTKSKWERRIWAPVVFILLFASFIVALG